MASKAKTRSAEAKLRSSLPLCVNPSHLHDPPLPGGLGWTLLAGRATCALCDGPSASGHRAYGWPAESEECKAVRRASIACHHQKTEYQDLGIGITYRACGYCS